MKKLLLLLSLVSFLHSQDNFKTWQDMKFTSVKKQEYDFSCGTAALLTLFEFQYGESKEEPKIISNFLDSLTKEKKDFVIKNGLSLEELKEIGLQNGFKVYVVQIPFKDLVKTSKPALIYIEDEKFRHFAVFRGFERGKVFLADPSLGNRSLNPKKFLKLWNKKIALFIVKNTKEKQDLKIKDSELKFLQYETLKNILQWQGKLIFPCFFVFFC